MAKNFFASDRTSGTKFSSPRDIHNILMKMSPRYAEKYEMELKDKEIEEAIANKQKAKTDPLFGLVQAAKNSSLPIDNAIGDAISLGIGTDTKDAVLSLLLGYGIGKVGIKTASKAKSLYHDAIEKGYRVEGGVTYRTTSVPMFDFDTKHLLQGIGNDVKYMNLPPEAKQQILDEVEFRLKRFDPKNTYNIYETPNGVHAFNMSSNIKSSSREARELTKKFGADELYAKKNLERAQIGEESKGEYPFRSSQKPEYGIDEDFIARKVGTVQGEKGAKLSSTMKLALGHDLPIWAANNIGVRLSDFLNFQKAFGRVATNLVNPNGGFNGSDLLKEIKHQNKMDVLKSILKDKPIYGNIAEDGHEELFRWSFGLDPRIKQYKQNFFFNNDTHTALIKNKSFLANRLKEGNFDFDELVNRPQMNPFGRFDIENIGTPDNPVYRMNDIWSIAPYPGERETIRGIGNWYHTYNSDNLGLLMRGIASKFETPITSTYTYKPNKINISEFRLHY